MGCFDTSVYYRDKNVHELYQILGKSNDDFMKEFSYIKNQKNFDILKRISKENEIIS